MAIAYARVTPDIRVAPKRRCTRRVPAFSAPDGAVARRACAGRCGRSPAERAEVAQKRPAATMTGQAMLLTEGSRGRLRTIVVYSGVRTDGDEAVAAVLAAMIELRLARELRELLAASYSVSVSFHDGALVIDTDLGGPSAPRALAELKALGTRMLDRYMRTDFIRARKQVVDRLLAMSGNPAMLVARVSRMSLADSGVDPAERLARRIARLRPQAIGRVVERRLHQIEPNVVVVADEHEGRAFLRALDARPRVAGL